MVQVAGHSLVCIWVCASVGVRARVHMCTRMRVCIYVQVCIRNAFVHLKLLFASMYKYVYVTCLCI